KALVDAGMTDILVGLESGRQDVLDRLGKHTTVAQNEKALKILRAHSIEPNVGFIMFEPDSTFDDLRENFAFLKRNHLLDRLEISVNVLYHHQIILAGSASYFALQKEGRLHISEHSVYEATTDYIHPDVSAFAAFMRRITNHIFDWSAGTWAAAAAGEPEARAAFSRVNAVLVGWFKAVLDDPSRLDAFEALVAEAKTDIDRAINN
ncbi:MAG: B12-binding domain-containing radical SAM protein, partial [Pseudoramibacter sp.]